MIVFAVPARRNRQSLNLANKKRRGKGSCNIAQDGEDETETSDKAVMKSFETLVGKTTRAAIADDRQIKQMVSKIVPAKTMAHIEFCRIEGGRMRITVDSAAWISRIRFVERQIIDMLRGHKFDSHTISYHVSPEIRPAQHKTVRTSIKTSGCADAVEAAAAAVADVNKGTDDSDRLRQELLKLARTLRNE